MSEITRLLIWGKTYPELSTKYKETVCTGACTEDGRPVRIYPVPLRYLAEHLQYQLYDWVEAPIKRNLGDSRPESYRVDHDKMRRVGRIETDLGWMARRSVIYADRSWHYECVEDLRRAERDRKTSLGFVKVGRVEKVWTEERSIAEGVQHAARLEAMKSQMHLFGEMTKDLAFMSARVHVRWRCARMEGPDACPGHTAGVLDWGLGELARKRGIDAAKQRMIDLSDVEKYDLAFFMGNFKQHPKNFGIIGLWYPKRADVQRHMSQFSLFGP